MYARIPWELFAVTLGSAEHAMGSTILHDSNNNQSRHKFSILLCTWRQCPYIQGMSIYLLAYVGRDSVVGIATRYRLDGPGIESCRSQ